MQFTQGLHRAVQQRPETVATVCDARRTTFRGLRDRVSRLAGGLRELGVRDGNGVATYALNSDDYLTACLAVPWAGAVCIPINCRWSVSEVAYALRDSEAVALIVDEHFAKHVETLLDECPFLRILVYAGRDDCPDGLVPFERLATQSQPIDDSDIGGDETFVIVYTGGTTGKPKGVMLSHDNICIAALGLMAEGAFADEPIGLHIAPMSHPADMIMVACLLLRGGTHVMPPRFTSEATYEAIADHGVTDLLVAPALLQALVDHAERDAHDTSSVRRIMYGASPVSQSLLARAMAHFSGAGFMRVYGMTEMSAVISVLPPALHARDSRKLGSAGRAAYHVRARIVDEAGEEVSPGEVGQIVASGPTVMRGYLNRPADTAEAVRDGWMHTGDVGYMDADGCIYVVDRMTDMIISGGENVYCAEVENVIARHPAVAAAAVIGIPSDQWGELVHAAVVLEPGFELTREALHEHCRQYIASYKCPRSLDIRDSLPMSGAGEVLKTELREPFWEGRERDRSAESS